VEVNKGNVEGWTQAICPIAYINLLYSGAYFAQSELSAPIPGVDWWIASYGTSTKPRAPWGTEAGWQFTDQRDVPGISVPVDCSVFDDGVWAQLVGGGGDQIGLTEGWWW
jgi:GH25 family lysozyme M1 (1,4-beta-N-acetylmuramidase)